MDFIEPQHQEREESLTFVVTKSTKNVFLAKILILLILTLLTGYFFSKDSAKEYEQGRELTEEKYLEGFDDYRAKLLNSKDYTNPIFSTFIIFIVVSFLIGSYELLALTIGFIIGKLIKW